MATLKNLVNETTNIKNELINHRDNLKNKLTSKGIELNDNENKLQILINKVYELNDYVYRFYLYKNGNEYTDITGGYVNTGTTGGSMKNDGTSLVIKAERNSSGFKVCFANTNNTINLSNYSVLKIECSIDNSDSTKGHVTFGLHNSKGVYPQTSAVVYRGGLDKGIVSIDIKNINSSQYLIIRPLIEATSSSTHVTCKVYNIWLEK